MIKLQGVIHFSLPVTDLERSARFYSELLGMKIVHKHSRMVFLKCGDDFLILAKGNTPLKYDSDKNTPVHHGLKWLRKILSLRWNFCEKRGSKYLTWRIERKVCF